MPITRPFAYNTGSTISGTIKVNNLSIGVSAQDYSTNPGGVKWWMGPDETSGYVVGHQTPDGTQPNQLSIPAYLGFFRSTDKTDSSFLSLINNISKNSYTGVTSARTWTRDNGYWTSYGNADAPSSGLILNLDGGNFYSYPSTGTTWYDLSGQQSNGTLNNTPTYNSNNFGYLNFSDTSFQNVTVPNIGDLNTWSVETWVRFTSSLSGKVTSVVCNQFNLSTKLNFSIGTNNAPSNYNLVVGFFDGGWRNTSGFTVTTNTWYHVVGTYDGSTIKQYVGGVLNSSFSYVGTPQSGGEVRIARRWDSPANDSSNYVNGDIGLVRIYNRALTSTEVTDLYNSSSSRYL